MSIHFVRITCLISLLLASVYTPAQNSNTPELTVGVEPFASTNVISRIINEHVNHALQTNGSPTLNYLGSRDIAEFKSQVANQEFSLFYGHPDTPATYLKDTGLFPSSPCCLTCLRF